MMHRSIAMLLAGTCLAAASTQAQAKHEASAPAAKAGTGAQPAGAAQPASGGTSTDQATQAEAQTNENLIVVTATKRPEVLIDVPQSISVVTGKTLEIQHANDFRDYLKLVPGLQLDEDTPGSGRLIIRGVNTGGVASTVGVYVDDTPFGSSSGLVNGAVLAGDFDTFDVNRIEVLRGPQGTLYGASSLSGVLRFVTNEPSTERLLVRGRGGVETVEGGDVGYSANLLVNVPLGSNVAFRASGFYRKNAGFIDSPGTTSIDPVGNMLTSDAEKNINDSYVYGGRASLLFKPSDAASIRLTAIAQNIDADASSLVEADPVTLEPLHGLTQSQFVPNFSNVHYRLYNATGDFDLGFAKLTSSTSYGTQKQHFRTDLTFPLSGLLQLLLGFPPNEFFEPQDTNDEKVTQEVRLAGDSPLLDWLVGGYYTHEKGLILQNFMAVSPGTSTEIPFPLPLGNARLDSKYEEVAGFADATIHFTPQFDLELGGRYSHNSQSAHQTSGGVLAGATDFSVHSSEDVFTYSVAPKYKVAGNTTLYARVAKGFRPGGPNVLPPSAPANFATYAADSLVSYEAGLKAETSDHRFSFDGAAFHIDWKDIQLFAIINNFGLNVNGTSAKSDGFELTATFRPTPGLELSANGAYTHARLTGDTPDVVGGHTGEQLPFTPKFSGAVNAMYQWYVGPDTTAHIGGSVRHVSGQSAAFDPDFYAAFGRQRHIRPYDTVDLNAGVDFGRFDIQAYVKNLTNSHGVTSTTGTTIFGGFPVYPGGAIGTGITQPRTIGVTVGINY